MLMPAQARKNLLPGSCDSCMREQYRVHLLSDRSVAGDEEVQVVQTQSAGSSEVCERVFALEADVDCVIDKYSSICPRSSAEVRLD